MTEALKIKIDTGVEIIDIEDETGNKIGEFKFNPADSNIINRLESVVEFFNKISFEESLSEEQKGEETKKLSAAIGQQFDFLLGFDVAEGIFGKCGALTVTRNGDFFFEKVFKGIANLIEITMDQRIDKKIAKANAAAAKYKK